MPAKAQPFRPAEPLLLSQRDAFRVLGIGETVGYALAKTGALPTVRIGGRKMIPIAELKRLASTVPQN